MVGGELLRAWLLRACLRAAMGHMAHAAWARLGACWAPSLVCGGFARRSFFYSHLSKYDNGLR